MHSLTRAEAAERAELLTVESYDVELDVTGGAERFRSTVRVRFRARAGAETFAEVKPAELRSARLNGAPLDVSTLDGNRLPLPTLAEANELVVEADMAYSNTGEGLHRFVDPSDGETYLYAMSFLDDAQRIFACFDQPDLKAPVTLAVRAPEGWLVAANGVSDGPGRFATTPPLATYFVSLIAGPYHVRHDEHDGIPLALYCRRSLAPQLDKDAEEIFTITKACLDRYHELFGVRYPFGKYDQAFVPEFNAGAMENPGLVTFRDDYLFRSAVTDGDREWRAVVIAHEMAHMWFGDLVTMRWWDDLWLNESFAEYLGVRVTGESTRFDRSWTTFGLRRKASGYIADQRPSTHPVAPEEVVDAAHALLNFDGISYAKGASVLRQLVASLGDEAFFAGLRAHFAAHRFGNATLDDLLAALSEASGRDLRGWADVWLRRAGVDTLRAEVTTVDGRYESVHIVQTGTPRPHRVGLGVYDGAVRRSLVLVDVVGERTEVAELAGEPVADMLLVNAGDLTFAKVRLDDASAGAATRILPALEDSLDRTVLWATVLDSVRDGESTPADLVALVVTAMPVETEPAVVEGVLGMTHDLLDRYLDPTQREIAMQPVAMACDRLLAAAPPGGSLQLAAARALVEVSIDARRLIGWLSRQGVPEGLRIDTDLRWALCYRLVVLGVAGPDRIEAELANDRSATGEQRAARCRAALPELAAKERAWRVIVEDTALSNRLVEAHAEGFWQPEQADLTKSYVERYFAEMPAAARLRTPWVADQVAKRAFPRYAVSAATRKAAAALLARDDLVPGLRRVVIDADDDLRRALAARG